MNAEEPSIFTAIDTLPKTKTLNAPNALRPTTGDRKPRNTMRSSDQKSTNNEIVEETFLKLSVLSSSTEGEKKNNDAMKIEQGVDLPLLKGIVNFKRTELLIKFFYTNFKIELI